MLICFSHVQLCDPINGSLPGSCVHGIIHAKILEWVALLQWIFPTQGSNLGLLNCRWILYPLSHLGSPGLPSDLFCSVLWFKKSLLAKKDFLQHSEDMDSHVAGLGLQIPCSWPRCWRLFHSGTGVQPQKWWELPHFGRAREQNSGLLD